MILIGDQTLLSLGDERKEVKAAKIKGVAVQKIQERRKTMNKTGKTDSPYRQNYTKHPKILKL